MTEFRNSSRREFLALLAAAGMVASAKTKSIPVGLELYSVRDELKKDMPGTLDAVAKMGYECVEFFSPYYDWSPDQAKEVRKHLDSLDIKCYSTHNGLEALKPEGLEKAIELNKILGAKYIVLAHPGDSISTLADWKMVAEILNKANNTMKSSGLHAGYHNHDAEFRPVDGRKPMELLANETEKSIMLQLDVGTCIEAGSDPVGWIDSHPGRIRSLHLKDWSPDKGYKVLFGEGVAPWKKIFAAAESTGGVEYYLIEQEGSQYPEIETADRCLVAFHNVHG
jgi:sugar phosphate isomerase/epimerase